MTNAFGGCSDQAILARLYGRLQTAGATTPGNEMTIAVRRRDPLHHEEDRHTETVIVRATDRRGTVAVGAMGAVAVPDKVDRVLVKRAEKS